MASGAEAAEVSAEEALWGDVLEREAVGRNQQARGIRGASFLMSMWMLPRYNIDGALRFLCVARSKGCVVIRFLAMESGRRACCQPDLFFVIAKLLVATCCDLG